MRSAFDVVLSVFLFDSRYGGVEMKGGIGGFDHPVEYLPVASVDGHCTFDGHADHCLKPMNETKILTIIDSSSGLNDVCSERWRNL